MNPRTGVEAGLGGVRIGLVDEALEDLARQVQDEGPGAVVSFTGMVRPRSGGREVRCLEYEAYRELAESDMARLASDAQRRWGLTGVTMLHRVGRVDAGRVSVVVRVSAPHRAAAFDACRFLIDELKSGVPIWKKEVFADGSAEWAPHA